MEVLQIFALPLVYHGSVVQYRKTKDRIQRDKGQNTERQRTEYKVHLACDAL